MADNATDILKLDEGTYLQQGGSIRSFEYYSRYLVVANTTETRIFTAKLGDTGFTRVDQTNMPAPGRIPGSQRMDIKGISVAYVSPITKSDANMALILAWMATTVFSLYIQDKTVMIQKRLSSWIGMNMSLVGAPATQVSTVTAATTTGALIRNNTHPIYRLEYKISLAANTDFWGQINPGVAAAAQQATDVDFVDVGLHGSLWSKV